jgi:hypothetical protein
MGVVPDSLSAEDGIEVATGCKSILFAHEIDDVHVEIRESDIFRSASPEMYKPGATSNATVRVRKPFSTALGLPICSGDTTPIEGTGGFFISDPRCSGKIYLITARHVVLRPDEDSNKLYEHHNPSQPHKNVLLFGDVAVEKHTTAIKSEIGGKHIIIDQLESRLEAAKQINEDAEEVRNQVYPQLEGERKAIGDLETFHTDVSKD